MEMDVQSTSLNMITSLTTDRNHNQRVYYQFISVLYLWRFELNFDFQLKLDLRFEKNVN